VFFRLHTIIVVSDSNLINQFIKQAKENILKEDKEELTEENNTRSEIICKSGSAARSFAQKKVQKEKEKKYLQ
jgi:hypothetical protein